MSHVDEGLLHAYLDGAFPPGDAQHDAISAHLALCADCRARLEEARNVKDRAVDVLRQVVPAAVRIARTGGFADVVARAEVARRAAAAAAAMEAAAGAAGDAAAVPAAESAGGMGVSRGRTAGEAAAGSSHGSVARPRRRFVPLAWAASLALALAAGWIAREIVFPAGPGPAVASGAARSDGGAAGAEAGAALAAVPAVPAGHAAGVAGAGGQPPGRAGAAAGVADPTADAEPSTDSAPSRETAVAGAAPAPGGQAGAGTSLPSPPVATTRGSVLAASGGDEREAGVGSMARTGAADAESIRPILPPTSRIAAIATPEPQVAIIAEHNGRTAAAELQASIDRDASAGRTLAATDVPPVRPPPVLGSQAALPPPPVSGLAPGRGQRGQNGQGGQGGQGVAALGDDSRQRLARDAADTQRGPGLIARVFGRGSRAAEPPPPAWRRATLDEAVRRFGGDVLQVAGHPVTGIWIVEEGELWSVRVAQTTDAGAALTLVQWRDAPRSAHDRAAGGGAHGADAEPPVLLRSSQRPDGTYTVIFELRDGSRLSIEAALPLESLLAFGRRLHPLDR